MILLLSVGVGIDRLRGLDGRTHCGISDDSDPIA